MTSTDPDAEKLEPCRRHPNSERAKRDPASTIIATNTTDSMTSQSDANVTPTSHPNRTDGVDSSTNDIETFRIASDPGTARRWHRCVLTVGQERVILAGFLIGFVSSLLYIVWVLADSRFAPPRSADVVDAFHVAVVESCNDSEILDDVKLKRHRSGRVEVVASIKKPLFIAVLTQQKYLASRGATCNCTWAHSSYLTDVEFFMQQSDASNSGRLGANVTHLTGTYSNDYFHAKKTFSLIEELCSRHVELYDWFLLATDDVYVRVNELQAFLARHDPDKKLYIGHRTFPVDDAAYSLLNGQPYCVTGPGIVLSRALMAGLCTVVSHCLSPRLAVILYPDVLLARCLRDHFNLTCSGHNKFFVDTYEDREMKQLRYFLEEAEQAITLHPVKSRWAMIALHTHYTELVLDHLLETLHSLEDRRQKLNDLTNILASDGKPTNAREPDLNTLVTEEAVFYEDLRVYKEHWCKPVEQPTPALLNDLKSVIHMANTSLQLGEGLQCPRMLSGQYRRHERGATYAVDFVCRQHGDRASGEVLAKVEIERSLKPLILKKIRKRKLNPEVAIIVAAWQSDPNLFPYLIRLDRVIRTRREHFAVYLLLRPGANPERENAPLESSHPGDIQWKAWWSGTKVTHRVFHASKHGSSTRCIQNLVQDLKARFPEATTIVTDTRTYIESDLITKCKVLARKNKQIYYPYPVQRVLGNRSKAKDRLTYSLFTASRRPYCLHAADLDTLLAPTESLLSVAIGLHKEEKQPKVIRTTEFALHVRLN